MRCVSVLVLHVHNSLGQACLLPPLEHGLRGTTFLLLNVSFGRLPTTPHLTLLLR